MSKELAKLVVQDFRKNYSVMVLARTDDERHRLLKDIDSAFNHAESVSRKVIDRPNGLKFVFEIQDSSCPLGEITIGLIGELHPVQLLVVESEPIYGNPILMSSSGFIWWPNTKGEFGKVMFLTWLNYYRDKIRWDPTITLQNGEKFLLKLRFLLIGIRLLIGKG